MKYDYLSDAELQKLIADTEESGMLKAPEYLESGIKAEIQRADKKVFTFYCIKIAAAAAAAIILIAFMPDAVHVPDVGRIGAIESINSGSNEFCDRINNMTEKVIIKEDR